MTDIYECSPRKLQLTKYYAFLAGIIELDRDKYELNVTATDDGKCCLDPGAPPADPSTKHTSTAVVVVFITDVNDNKPVFEDCASYSPKVGSLII